jgi:hypothetical protein
MTLLGLARLILPFNLECKAPHCGHYSCKLPTTPRWGRVIGSYMLAQYRAYNHDALKWEALFLIKCLLKLENLQKSSL